jgi:hypothetical protein
MKSCAPALSASTAASSPIVPEMMMKGRSSPLSFKIASAESALKVGIE